VQSAELLSTAAQLYKKIVF